MAEPYIVIDDGEPGDKHNANRLVTSALVVKRIIESSFAARWSMYVPSCITPKPRTSQFCVYIAEQEAVITGYGIGSSDDLLSDVWKLNLRELSWQKLKIGGEPVPPRNGTTAVRIGHLLCLFGGFNGSTYLADFHIIDMNTLQVSFPSLKGGGPSGRVGHVMATNGTQILIWGGYNGDWLSDLWILETSTLSWRKVPSDLKGRTSAAWTNNGDNLYIYGAAKSDALLRYSWRQEVLETVKTTGSAPPPEISQASMVSVDKYLLVFGGKWEQRKYSLMYGFDTDRNWWFVFHIIPDGVTATINDGTVDKNGAFMVPRTWSASICYHLPKRSVVLFLGAPFLEPPNLGIVDVGEALSFLHHQNDLLDMLRK